jgi:hypothetical protein
MRNVVSDIEGRTDTQRAFKNMVPRGIFGQKKDDVT